MFENLKEIMEEGKIARLLVIYMYKDDGFRKVL